MALLIGGGIAAVVALAVIAGLLLQDSDDPVDEPSPQPTQASPPPLPPWRIDVVPAGSLGRVTRKERGRVRAQAPDLARLVRSVQNTLFLSPFSLREVGRSYFSSGALTSFRRTSGRLERQAVLLRRRARIAVEVERARTAAAEVLVISARPVGRPRLATRTRLWLERAGQGWRIVGYEVDQTRMVLEDKKERDKKERDKKERDKKEREKKKRDDEKRDDKKRDGKKGRGGKKQRDRKRDGKGQRDGRSG